MSITVFFPQSFSWKDANDWVAERRLPVTMHALPANPFAGQSFARYCDEIGLEKVTTINEAEAEDSPKRVERTSLMVYHRAKVQLRR